MSTLNEIMANLVANDELLNALNNAEFLPPQEVEMLLSSIEYNKSEDTYEYMNFQSVLESGVTKTPMEYSEYIDNFDCSYFDNHPKSFTRTTIYPIVDNSQTVETSASTAKPAMTLDELMNVLMSPVSLPRTPETPERFSPTSSVPKEKKVKVLDQQVFYLPESTFKKDSKKRINQDAFHENNCQNKRRCRTTFSTQQLSILSYYFDQDEYISNADLTNLSKQLNVEERRVKVWFQNRRNKKKSKTQKS